MINVQRWINDKYRTKEEKAKVEILRLDKEGLAGELDLTNFTNLRKIEISHCVDKEEITFKNKLGSKVDTIRFSNPQQWLDENYSINGVCKLENDQYNKNFCKARKNVTDLGHCRQTPQYSNTRFFNTRRFC